MTTPESILRTGRKRQVPSGRSKALTRIDTPEYRKHYNWGWRYCQGANPTLDYVDSKYGDPPKPGYDAALDGYLDCGAGRDKWHLLNCPDHDACGEA